MIRKTLILGKKTQNLTFTLSERKGLEILEKVEKSWKKLKKWPNNHYLATLGIYLQFHDFQSFSKKITEKILTAWFSNWWSQYVRKCKCFPNNIPKNILRGDKTVKKNWKPPFFGFFLMKHQREAPPTLSWWWMNIWGTYM